VGDINTPLSPVDKSAKQKINKGILELKDIIDQIYLTEYFIQQKHMELSPKQIISLGTKQALENIGK
jgi:hypothetical protein